jgi:ubiquinone/menaquinone biosynthesis C-methylase UbiE
MGYGPASTAIMATRTAASHAAFFVPHLKSGMSVLDCGCGPGTITLGFAEIVAPGQVIGTEIESSQVEIARQNALKATVSNVRFEVADIYDLPFEESSLDAIFISAVLGNLKDPVRGLSEANRVLKPGGVIGVKEFDHGLDILYPVIPSVQNYNDLYLRLRRENGHDPEIGRKVGSYLDQAGFGDVRMSANYEAYADPVMLRGAVELNIGLLTESWGEAFISRGWATSEEIEAMSDAWRGFANLPGAIFAVAWCEALARKFGVQ